MKVTVLPWRLSFKQMSRIRPSEKTALPVPITPILTAVPIFPPLRLALEPGQDGSLDKRALSEEEYDQALDTFPEVLCPPAP
jgi:hypothetical protein